MTERYIPGKDPADALVTGGSQESHRFLHGTPTNHLKRFVRRALAANPVDPRMAKATLEFADASFWIESQIGDPDKHTQAAVRRAQRWGLSEQEITQASALAQELYGKYKSSIGVQVDTHMSLNLLNAAEELSEQAKRRKIVALANRQNRKERFNRNFRRLIEMSDDELLRTTSNDRIMFEDDPVFSSSGEAIQRKFKKRLLTETEYAVLNGKVRQMNKSDDPYERVADIISIGRNDAKATQTLVRALRDKDDLRRQAAAEKLTQLGWKPTSDSERVLYYLAKDDWDGISSMGEHASGALLNMLGKGNPDERETAIAALGLIDWDPREASPQQQAIYYASKEQWGALKALGPNALPGYLLLIRKDNNVYARRIAAQLLDVDVMTPDSLGILAGLQKDRDSVVRSYAKAAASRISRSPFSWQKVIRELRSVKLPLVQALLSLHPDWADVKPSTEDFENVMKAVSYLPPVGGKVVVVRNGRITSGYEADKLAPTLTMEEQVDSIIRMRQKGRLGDLYIHQLTVQGRLPDEFKYAALALILHSPYVNDWTKPFFEAPWGTVAPMVHDGGSAVFTKTGLNPVWMAVSGRTDFLQRVVPVREPKVEELEKLAPLERSKYPVEVLANARAEQLERGRLFLEARAYQRLALALHAKELTAPEAIPSTTRNALAEIWRTFRKRMNLLLREYNVHGAVETTWFYMAPREVKGWEMYGLRHEGEWELIQAALLQLEQTRIRYPDLTKYSENLLENTTQQIDQQIGLTPR